MSKHPIVHIEIPVQSLEGGGKFYSDVFGWETSVMPEFNYGGWDTGAGFGGGFTVVGGEGGAEVGDVVVYVGSDDIDADLAKINAAGGGTVVPKTEIPGIGWFAIFTDTTGNRLGLYTGLEQAD